MAGLGVRPTRHGIGSRTVVVAPQPTPVPVPVATTTVVQPPVSTGIPLWGWAVIILGGLWFLGKK